MELTSLIFALMLLFVNITAQNGSNNISSLSASQTPAKPAPSFPQLESVWVKVLAGINTECKTCPNSLCSNKNFYGSLLMFRATCWTSGQKINATDMWLHSEEGCYVTVQDTLKYWRNYTQDLKPCQNVPKPVAASRRMSAKAATDCRRCPNDKCEIIKSYERRSEVFITCRAQALPNCLETCLPSDIPPANETTVFPWLKTNFNCYVKTNSVTQAMYKRQIRPFQDCGPVPYLDSSFRSPPPAPPTTSTVTFTSTLSLYYPITTTVIVHQNPCAGPNCPPLIWAFTPAAAATMSSPFASSPTSTGNSTLTPTNDTVIPLTPPTIPAITTTPINDSDVTVTPTTESGNASTPINNPGITPTSVLLDPIPLTHTPTLPPKTMRSVMANVGQPYSNHISTEPPKCKCETPSCEGGAGFDSKEMCAALAAERCAKTCPSARKATQAAMDPFQPLMSEGGRPLPSHTHSEEQMPAAADLAAAPNPAPLIRV